VQVSEIDADDAAFDAWYAVVDASVRHERQGERDWLPDELRALARDGRPRPDGTLPDELRTLLAARDDAGVVVGALALGLPLADNTHVAAFELWVHPRARRRGAGTALLAQAERRARDVGRTTLVAEVDEPPHLRGRSPGRAFAAAHGFTCALEEVRRDLALPVAEERIAALESAAWPHAAGYRALTVVGSWPDELVDGRARLGARMSTDAPLGELDWQPEAWDAARVRRQEELFRAQGRALIAAGVVHERTGELVAFTELAVPDGEARVWQWDTLVLPEHRGHRLGTLVKTAALRLLQAEAPAARLVTTHNAAENRWMIDVNEAMGFVPNGVLGEWQRAL
jgi:GNAT superfamily N-acetyltransferase